MYILKPINNTLSPVYSIFYNL